MLLSKPDSFCAGIVAEQNFCACTVCIIIKCLDRLLLPKQITFSEIHLY